MRRHINFEIAIIPTLLALAALVLSIWQHLDGKNIAKEQLAFKINQCEGPVVLGRLSDDKDSYFFDRTDRITIINTGNIPVSILNWKLDAPYTIPPNRKFDSTVEFMKVKYDEAYSNFPGIIKRIRFAKHINQWDLILTSSKDIAIDPVTKEKISLPIYLRPQESRTLELYRKVRIKPFIVERITNPNHPDHIQELIDWLKVGPISLGLQKNPSFFFYVVDHYVPFIKFWFTVETSSGSEYAAYFYFNCAASFEPYQEPEQLAQ